MTRDILILGATSGIARALARVLAKRRCRLILAGRNPEEIQKVAADLQLRYGAPCIVERFDALDFEGHAEFFARCVRDAEGELGGVILCYGSMTEQAKAEESPAEARRMVDVNFTSAVSILGHAANYFEERRGGFIAAISSVAGDRGRRSNYIYGASKAGLSVYLGGLRNRLHRSGVHVLTIKPGFIDTPMTRGKVDAASPLLSTPERAADDIDRAIRARRDIIYTPWFWSAILLVIRTIPETLFKRMNF